MDACWTFGLNMPSWSKCTKTHGAEPLSDVALALLVRYLDMFPESCPVVKAIKPADFYFRLARYNEMQPKEDRISNEILQSFGFFGAILGRDQAAGYRWVRQEGGTRPVIDRYINILDQDLAQGVITLKDITALTMIENSARKRDSKDLIVAPQPRGRAIKR